MEEKSIKMWVATDEDGDIFIYENKPERDEQEVFAWYNNSGRFEFIEQRFLPFPAPTWEDEPIEVEITIKKV